MAITKVILGERCSTKEAVLVLEAAQVLACVPHDVDPDARLTTAAIAMRRSEWWWSTPIEMHLRGAQHMHGGCFNRNECSGEIPWR